MKKTILLTLILAGMSSAATTLTLDTAIVKDTDHSKVSAFEAALNKTAAEANTVDGIANAAHLGYKSSNKPTITFTLQDMFGAPAPSDNTAFQLSKLSFLSRDDGSDIGYGSLTLSVTGKTGEGTTATSSTFTIEGSGRTNTNGTEKTDVFRAVTWTFGSPLVFTMSDTLSLSLTIGTTNFGMGAFVKETGYTFAGNNEGMTNNSTDYYNFFRLEAEVIPEPTTATLSLLALAGLAARRRRK